MVMQVLCAIAAIVAFASGLVVLVGRTVAANSALGRAAAFLVERRVQYSALIGVAATLGSLYFSEIVGYVPCRLCWFQRTMMYPIAVVGVVAWVRKDQHSRWYLAALAGIGLAVSLWHNLIEWFPTLETSSCSATGPACALVYFRVFGVLSLATMAAAGFFAVLVLNTAGAPRPVDNTGSPA